MTSSRSGFRWVSKAGGLLLGATVLAASLVVAPGTAPTGGAPSVVPYAGAPVMLATPAPRRPHPHRKPWPITMTVQTVPAIGGLHLSLDGVKAVTNGHGRASFTQEHNFAPHTLRLIDTKVTSASKRLQFSRWAGQRDPDQAYRTTVTGLPMRMSYTVTAAFAVQVPVTAKLVNLQGTVVDPARVSALTIRSGRQGDLAVPPSGRLWLDSLVPVYRDSGFRLVPETYSLTGVIVLGTNTVDVGNQQFEPSKEQSPVFHAKFFTLTVTAHDLLLKNAIGSAARVTYPDGTLHTAPFPASGTVVLPDLPRGAYKVTVQAGGTALVKQLVLSRDSAVDVGVATHLDYGLLIGGIALVMAVLLLIGRARHWARRRVVWLWFRSTQAVRGTSEADPRRGSDGPPQDGGTPGYVEPAGDPDLIGVRDAVGR